MDTEAFQLLSRGGSFNKARFKKDVELFTRSQTTTRKIEETSESLPTELDFFKYAQGSKRKSEKKKPDPDERVKRRRLDGGEEETRSRPEATRKHHVSTKGSNVPAPLDSFTDLRDRYHVLPHVLANLSRNGFEDPTGIQSYGIPILLDGRDLVAISPTGTGKTLSFVLPLIAALNTPSASSSSDPGSGVRAVIIAPTRELAHQIHNECLKLAEGRKWKIVLLSKATATALTDKNVGNRVDIIISTPMRLVATIQSGILTLNNVRHLVLDEADRLLDTEFIDQVQEVITACSHSLLQKAVFSATLPSSVEKIAIDMLNDPIRVVVGLKDTPLPLVAQTLTYVADDSSKLPTLLAHLSQPYDPPVLIFTSTQSRASSLAEELVLHGVSNVDCLHAGMTKKERDEAAGRMRKGDSWVMISTEVMARGMDFKGIRQVINYDFPTSVQSYIHRIGRTGRAGREGKAVTYFTNEDSPYLKSIANVLLQSGSQVPDWILKLPKPSKMKRKLMGKVKRSETVNASRAIGRKDSIKRREMIAGSKRRKVKEQRKAQNEAVPSE